MPSRFFGEKEPYYRAIVENAGEGIVLALPEGTFIFVNQRFADMLGYDVDEILGKSGDDFTFEKSVVTRIRKCLKKGEIVRQEIKFRRKDGSVLWSSLNSSPIYDENGKQIANVGLHTDITEKRRTEEALRKSEDLFRTTQELSPDGFMVLHPERDAEGRIVDFTWVYENGGKRTNQRYGSRSDRRAEAP